MLELNVILCLKTNKQKNPDTHKKEPQQKRERESIGRLSALSYLLQEMDRKERSTEQISRFSSPQPALCL